MSKRQGRQSSGKRNSSSSQSRRRLHIPHRSRHVPDSEWRRTYPGPVPPQWQEIAAAKGFLIVDRVRDRSHVVLRCRECGADTVQKAYVLRTALPICGGCLETRRLQDAAKCGFTLLERDEMHHKYGHYRLPCGHAARLQFGRVERLAREGKAAGRAGFHCPTCYAARLSSDAAARGWTLLGPDPEANPNYRSYRHDGCGHTQRIAIANIITGRVGCEQCGTCWSAAPSEIYVLAFEVPHKGSFIKLGYSRDPESRLRYQLGIPGSVEATVLYRFPMPTGHIAQKTEKALHGKLKQRFPDWVIPCNELADWINVKTEIYRADILPHVIKLLKAASANQQTSPRSGKPRSSG